MLLTSDEAITRLESPDNLINRLRRATTSDPRVIDIRLPERSRREDATPTTMPPSIDSLIDNLDGKIALSSIQSDAIELMKLSMNELKIRIPQVNRPEKLAAIANDMGKLVSNIREHRGDQTNNIQVLIYAPQVKSEDAFDVISGDA